MELGTLEFFDASPLWNLERKAVLFLHPTLDSLVVHHAYHERDLLDPPAEDSNAPVDYWRSPIFDADLGPGSTSLKTLRLFLCEIDPAALIKILSFPRDLEHFTLTYPDYASHRVRVAPAPIDAVCIALEQQKHSLISLNVHGLNQCYPKPEFDTFKRLKDLSIDLDMLCGAWDEDSSVLTDDHEPSFGLDKFFPPSLEKLTVRYRLLRGERRQDVYRFECLEKCLADQSRILVSLQTLVLVEEKYVDRIYGSLQDVGEEMRKQIARIQERLICNGVAMLQETELLEADPYSPRLRDLMGYHGNKTYRESYERRWGPIPEGQP